MKGLSDKVYDALRSVKLATALIVLIALLAAAGGIIPQGRTGQFYAQKFPGAPVKIILALGLDKVFTGVPFLALAALFTVNLTVCSFHRFGNELRKPRAKRRHGPDILHIGILIFILGGILSSRTRTETSLYLAKGQAARLPDGSSVTLADLREERYPDGRPKSWESHLVIDAATATAKGGATDSVEGDYDTIGETGYMGENPSGAAKKAPSASQSSPRTSDAAPIIVKVNSPLRYKGYTIYQQDWDSELRVTLEDPLGMKLRLYPGAKAPMMGGSVLFMTMEKRELGPTDTEKSASDKAVFLVSTATTKEILKASPGDKVGAFTFTAFEEYPISGLKIVRDRGYPLVATGLGLIVLGTFLTYIRKLKGMFA